MQFLLVCECKSNEMSLTVIASSTITAPGHQCDIFHYISILICYLCSMDRFGDSEGESLAISPQQGSGGDTWPSHRPEDSDNQRNVKRTDQTSIQIPPVTITSPPGETTLIQSQYQLRPTRCAQDMAY